MESMTQEKIFCLRSEKIEFLGNIFNKLGVKYKRIRCNNPSTNSEETLFVITLNQSNSDALNSNTLNSDFKNYTMLDKEVSIVDITDMFSEISFDPKENIEEQKKSEIADKMREIPQYSIKDMLQILKTHFPSQTSSPRPTEKTPVEVEERLKSQEKLTCYFLANNRCAFTKALNDLGIKFSEEILKFKDDENENAVVISGTRQELNSNIDKLTTYFNKNHFNFVIGASFDPKRFDGRVEVSSILSALKIELLKENPGMLDMGDVSIVKVEAADATKNTAYTKEPSIRRRQVSFVDHKTIINTNIPPVCAKENDRRGSDVSGDKTTEITQPIRNPVNRRRMMSFTQRVGRGKVFQSKTSPGNIL